MYRNRTKEKLYRALYKLATDRPVAEVSVSKLVSTAGVNRSTFYYHFESTQAVLEEMISDFCKQYLRILSMPPGETAHSISSEHQQKLEDEVCAYVASTSDDIRFFLSTHNYLTFRKQFFLCFQGYCRDHQVMQTLPGGKVRPLKRGVVYDYYLRMLAAQLLEILEYWAERNFSEGPEDFIHLFDALHSSTISLQG